MRRPGGNLRLRVAAEAGRRGRRGAWARLSSPQRPRHLRRQALTALRAAASQHPAPALGRHAGPKSVGARPAHLAWLIRTFHDFKALKSDRKTARQGTVLRPACQYESVPTDASGAVVLGIDFRPFFPGSKSLEASLWSRCLRALENELPEQDFNTWVRPLQALKGDGGLRLLAPNRFVVDWVRTHLLARLAELLRDFGISQPVAINVEVGSRPAV